MVAPSPEAATWSRAGKPRFEPAKALPHLIVQVHITPDTQVCVCETISRPLKILRQKKYKHVIMVLFNCLKISG